MHNTAIYTGIARTYKEFLDRVDGFSKHPLPTSQILDSKEQLTTFYRGHASIDYICQPSVFRNGKLKREDEIYKACEDKFPCEFKYLETTFDKLAKMQHYGAATRILDFTYSPDIALFFACFNFNEDEKKKDGRVIIYRTNCVEPCDPGVRALSFLATYPYQIDREFYDKLRLALKEDYPDSFWCSVIKKSYFVKPKMSNERLRRQQGAFAIFGQKNFGEQDQITKEEAKLDDNFGRGEEYPGYIGYITIPAKCKESILSELQKNEITKERLFPNIEKEFQKISEGEKEYIATNL